MPQPFRCKRYMRYSAWSTNVLHASALPKGEALCSLSLGITL